ncbi:tetratricopeptide repeat protein [Tropicimonas sp. S265A]|uniref:tetratricopeptide repeat protein n=1 Tax=Tropicimonas sp. S265A TaxID=3415134 RepID=UPI003C7E5216
MTAPTDLDPDEAPDDIRRALARVVRSDAFARSERLKAFLSYIVEEALAGRGEAILGKTIAQDVYDRDPSRTETAENLVRVDAGRLRRKLEAFYAAEGAADPLRIVMDPGGYAPRFVPSVHPAVPTPEPAVPNRRRVSVMLGSAAALALAVGAGVFWTAQRAASVAPPESAREIERQALAAKSAAAVQAANLCDQARGFLFPIADVESQQTAIAIFRRASETDPGLSCGYAGLAHAQATLALLSGTGAQRETLIEHAARSARRAVDLAPTDGWSQSAAAWAAYAKRDYAEAERLSALAAKLGPSDGNVLDFRATIATVTGDFQTALAATDPGIPRDFGSVKFARSNIRAVALYHLGDYEAAIASIETAIQNGDPVSPLTLVYLVSANQKAGNVAQAQAYAQELSTTWPDARPDIGINRLYAEPTLAEQVLTPLEAAGWQAPDGAL